MTDKLTASISGHIKAVYTDTGEVVLDKPNAIHFGNISTKIAEALVGRPSSFITYMAFGNYVS